MDSPSFSWRGLMKDSCEQRCVILHVIVVGFHHKKGCQIEYCYPPLSEDGTVPLPWQNLPTLALPDGAHNVEQDVIYFLLPSLENPNQAVFGISCYRQMHAKELLNRPNEVTRNTVQKSVCVISTVPLFGVLTAKLELITQAYFNERDFAKVEVLSQMYKNLCDLFTPDNIDEGAASMDISTRSLILCFKHRFLVLMKLLLLEKRVVFYVSPVHHLGATMIALVSLFPRLLEEGLFQAAAYCKIVSVSRSDVDSSAKAKDFKQFSRKRRDDGSGSSLTTSGKEKKENEEKKEEDKEEKEDSDHERPSSLSINDSEDYETAPEAIDIMEFEFKSLTTLSADTFGFPLSIFTKGSLFHPYLSISYLDIIRSVNTRAYCIGATNTLFVQRRDTIDVIVTISESGDGSIEIVNDELKKALSLTAADLRFADFILKGVQANTCAADWDGGDDWIRLHARAYLLSLIASARADLKDLYGDFNESFIDEWKLTNNFRIWSSGDYPDLASTVPGHPFAGSTGVSDMFLKVQHSVGITDGSKRLMSAVSSTGKYFSERGLKVKSSISSWFQGSNSSRPNS